MKGIRSAAQNVIQGLVKKPITLNSGGTATTDGAAIEEPWRLGRVVEFQMVGDVPGSSGLTVKVIGKKRSDGNWEALKDKDGNDLAFTASKLADGAALETGSLYGSIPVSKLDAEKYSAITLRAANAEATNVVWAATYQIRDLYELPSSQVDDLVSKLA